MRLLSFLLITISVTKVAAAAELGPVPALRSIEPCQNCFSMAGTPLRASCDTRAPEYKNPVVASAYLGNSHLRTAAYAQSYTYDVATDKFDDRFIVECTTPATGSLAKKISRYLTFKTSRDAPLISELREQLETTNGKVTDEDAAPGTLKLYFYKDEAGMPLKKGDDTNLAASSLFYEVNTCRQDQSKACWFIAEATDNKLTSVDLEARSTFMQSIAPKLQEAERAAEDKRKSEAAPVPKL